MRQLLLFSILFFSLCIAQSNAQTKIKKKPVKTYRAPAKKYNSNSSTYNSSNDDNDESGSKYCFDDSYDSGNKFELRLLDGGDAKIIIKNNTNEIIRTGRGSWSGSSDGPGGNPPTIRLNLSTGVLRFTAIVDGYSSTINMLIDSRDNQWIKCW
jgi:hypothetical protein